MSTLKARERAEMIIKNIVNSYRPKLDTQIRCGRELYAAIAENNSVVANGVRFYGMWIREDATLAPWSTEWDPGLNTASPSPLRVQTLLRFDCVAISKAGNGRDWYFTLDPDGNLMIVYRAKNITEIRSADEFLLPETVVAFNEEPFAVASGTGNARGEVGAVKTVAIDDETDVPPLLSESGRAKIVRAKADAAETVRKIIADDVASNGPIRRSLK